MSLSVVSTFTEVNYTFPMNFYQNKVGSVHFLSSVQSESNSNFLYTIRSAIV